MSSATRGGPTRRRAPLAVAALGLLAVLVSGVSAPVSAAPVSAAPVSAAPVSAAPVSAAPVSAAPVSVAARALPEAAAPPGAVPAATGQPGETLQVAIKPLEPFVTRAGTDRYSGFSIDVWNEVARRNAWDVRYRWYDDLPTALADVQAAKVDVAIAGISITRQREEVVDFSYPMFNSGLEVLTSTTGAGSAWTDELGGFASAVGWYLLALGVGLIVAGHAVWLATRRRLGRGYLVGVGLGTYKAAGLGLVGDFGVGDPKRPLARLSAVLWVICGICFVSLFTATVTAQLTVQTIQGKISGVQDLAGARVVTVSGTTAAAYLKNHSIPFTAVESIDQAYPMLDGGQADAVVFDAPVLEHHVQVTNTAKEIVVGGIFAPEDYGIAFPTGSVLRKKVNTTLLAMRADGTYDGIYAKYFGTARGR